jgi:PAS domain S-box-containing protein
MKSSLAWNEPPVTAGPAWSEADRLAALRDYGILDTAPEAPFDDLAKIAAHICNAPIALISFVDASRQWFKAEIGLGQRTTSREVSICAHAILQPEQGLFVVPDTTKDASFAANPLVTGEPFIRFYAGALLETPQALPLGTLCVIDHQPRPEGLTAQQGHTLQALARQVITQLEHRRALVRLAAQQAKLAESERRFRAIADTMPQIVWSNRPDGFHDYFNRRWYEFTGATPEQSEGSGWSPMVHPEDRERAFAAWRHALATGEPYEIEYRLRTKDGSYRWFIGRALAVRNGDGEIERWYGTCTDVDDLKRSEESRELLTRELSHRIKNIFAVVSGLAASSARGHPEAASFAQDFRERVNALAQAHEYVRPHSAEVAPALAGETVQGLMRVLLAPYLRKGSERISIAGDDAPIGPASATALALVLHEQATNAVKYGALSNEAGQVCLTGKRENDSYVLTWQERGGPPVSGPPERKGFGTQMTARSVVGQLGGSLTYDWDPDGLTMRLSVPDKTLLT